MFAYSTKSFLYSNSYSNAYTGGTEGYKIGGKVCYLLKTIYEFKQAAQQ